jgi:DNA gyrase subunit B
MNQEKSAVTSMNDEDIKKKTFEKETEKQRKKVEAVAQAEGSTVKPDAVKKPLVEEAKKENFDEEHVEHVTLDEKQEEKAMKAKGDYTGKDIEILQGLEAVRQRPGMYIGTTSSKGLHHLVREAVDNGIDEALAGYCKHIHVTLLPGTKENPINRCRVEDDGRGIPCDINEQTKLSTVETVYTILHAGGKFNDKTGYKISGGLHGVGVKAVNALSSAVHVTVYRDGLIHVIDFENGGNTIKPGLRVVGPCPAEKTGTTVEFTPDPLIFKETTTFDYSTINDYLRQTAYLTKGLDITLDDLRSEDNPLHAHYCFQGGIQEYVAYINQEKDRVFEAIPYINGGSTVETGGLDEKPSSIIVECALQPTKAGIVNMNSFCNNIRTTGGGTHEEGLKLAIGRELNAYFKVKGWLGQDEENFRSDDCYEGLTVVLSIKHNNPQYEGQVKDKLGNDEVRRVVSSIVGDYLKTWLMENPKEGRAWFERVLSAFKGRKAADRAREMAQGRLSGGSGMPDKLTDCVSKNPAERELFIVEGNSAGGSAVQGRDANTQAILPLRGKILNVEKAQATRIEKNVEIYNLVTAIGAGQGEAFDVSKIRYDKVIIMTDADVDGSHIRILLMTFFYRFMKPLVETGHLYIAQPPLYRLTYQGHHYYAFTDAELDAIKAKLPLTARYSLQRYKGLGEMDPSQLDETTMDRNHRRMLQVTIEDAQAANDALIDLMGENIEPRKDYITANAKFVKNLDI